jgi:hypothetical protein
MRNLREYPITKIEVDKALMDCIGKVTVGIGSPYEYILATLRDVVSDMDEETFKKYFSV